MQVQRQLGKKVGKKIYPKYVIVIPEKLIKKAGFKAKTKLKADVKKGEIKLKRK